MKLLYKLENKFGKYALRNLSGIIIACFGISYLLWMFFPSIYELFVFDYFYVFAGHQYWRIFTWIFTMPGGIDVFTILMLFIYYSIGNSVERAVGTFLYNVYIFGALIMLTIAQVVAGLYEYLQMPEFYDTMYETMKSSGMSMYNQDILEAMSSFGPTYFLSISVFLGFALAYSDAMMLFFFILPVKASWLAYVDLIVMAYYFIKYDDWMLRAIILAVVLNFVLFYLIVKKYRSYRRFKATSAQIKFRKEYRKKIREADIEGKNTPPNITRHKCAICGRSEKDSDELEFRFCSKCNGNYEYCNEHLFTHEHVK